MKRILAQATKELNQFWRDRLTVALAIVLPLLTLFIFGFAIRLESKDLPVVIQDLDISPRSRAYVEQIFATNKFQPVSWPLDQPPEEAIDEGKARAVIVIPPDFERQLSRGESVAVQVLIDGTDANNARFVQNSIRATTTAFNRSSGLLRRAPPVEADVRLWFNPGREESLYIVPGVFGVVLWIFPSLLAAIAMVREKERGTIIQVYASDLSAQEELLLGKELAYWLVRHCPGPGGGGFGDNHLWSAVCWGSDSISAGHPDFPGGSGDVWPVCGSAGQYPKCCGAGGRPGWFSDGAAAVGVYLSVG
jgi:ABC-2 type transport system permease protein